MSKTWRWVWGRKIFFAALTLELLALLMVLFTDLSGIAVVYAVVGIAIQVFLGR